MYSKMSLEQQLSSAIDLAMEIHKDQYDRSNQPYIGHVIRVMNAGQTLQEKIVGALHDVVEDSDLTIDDLLLKGFDNNIVEAVDAITFYDDVETYDEYIERVIKNPIAVKVKLNDLSDNMDLRRLNEIDDESIVRVRKYFKAYKRIINSYN